MCVCLCVCVSAPEAINNPYDWLNKFYGFYMAAVVGISSGRDISMYMRRGN